MKPILLSALILVPLAAQNVTPPPRPQDSGPSYTETIQFIQNKIAEAGNPTAELLF